MALTAPGASLVDQGQQDLLLRLTSQVTDLEGEKAQWLKEMEETNW